MQTGIIVAPIAVVGLIVAIVLSRQLKAYGQGQASSIAFLQGRYVLGLLVMIAIAAAVGGAITFLLGQGTTLFLALTAALSLFGVAMLVVGSK